MKNCYKPIFLFRALLTIALGVLSCQGCAYAIDLVSKDTVKYTAEPGDELNIQVDGEKDLSGIFKVGLEGAIEHPILGSVRVQDLTMAQIKEMLTDVLGTNYLTHPSVRVSFFQMRRSEEMPIVNSKKKITKENVVIGEAMTSSKLSEKENSTTRLTVDPKETKETADASKKVSFFKQAVVRTNETVRPASGAEAGLVEQVTVGNDNVASASTFDNDIVEIGDRLNIQVYKEPDLSGVFSVNFSGKINYPLLGELEVRLLTIDKLKQLLYTKLSEEYVANPQIEVTFMENPNKSVSILGQVMRPGNYPLTHRSPTLLGLVAQIGGFTQNAATKNIRIVRSLENEKKETIEVNMDNVIQGQAQDVPLKPGDIIFVDLLAVKRALSSDSHVTLLGQIARPGNYNLGQKQMLIELIGEAGGFTPVASTSRVKIIRKDKSGKKHSFYVNVDRIMAGAGDDVEIKEGDLIVVSESYF